jgi:hypothetical protein
MPPFNEHRLLELEDANDYFEWATTRITRAFLITAIAKSFYTEFISTALLLLQ